MEGGVAEGIDIYTLLQTISTGDCISLNAEGTSLEVEIKPIDWLDVATGRYAEECRAARRGKSIDNATTVVYYTFSIVLDDDDEDDTFEETLFGEWFFDFSKQNEPIDETVVPVAAPAAELIRETISKQVTTFTITRGEPVYTKSARKT
jgi:hypothetical protein